MARTFTWFLLFAPLVPMTVLGLENEPDRPKITFLDATAGADTIAGNDNDPFFAKLHLREAATMTGVAIGDRTIEESRKFARGFFRAAVLDFSDDERDALQLHLDRVIEEFGDAYPLLIRRPWKFVKTRRDLCGGFSFTRGDTIVVSESTLARFVKAANSSPLETKNGESLLLHEQMHVLQRARPNLFTPLYEQVFHFRNATVKVDPWIDERQVTNPDGISDNWVAFTTGDNGDAEATYWIGTVLLNDKPVHAMGRDFSSVAVRVIKNGAGYQMAVGEDGRPSFKSLDELSEFTSRLPIHGGYDHPNEVAAYLFTVITHGPDEPHLTGQAAEVMRQAREWFSENLTAPGARRQSKKLSILSS